MNESDRLIHGLAIEANAALSRYVKDTLAPKIRQWEIIEAAARRVVTAQERMGQGSWLPSAKDIDECDAAWDGLRTALDTAREEA